jgi:hypothetical protein
MYHAIKMSLVDQHTHRFLWRDDERDVPDTYVMTSVSFGDKPSGNIATVALRKTAEMMNGEYPVASQIILNNTYVDDIADSVEDTGSAVEITDQIERVIERGGFQIKHWIYTAKDEDTYTPREWPNCGEPMPQTTTKSAAQSIGDNNNEQKVLGLQWNPKDDCFRFKVTLNFAPRIRKVRSGLNSE